MKIKKYPPEDPDPASRKALAATNACGHTRIGAICRHCLVEAIRVEMDIAAAWLLQLEEAEDGEDVVTKNLREDRRGYQLEVAALKETLHTVVRMVKDQAGFPSIPDLTHTLDRISLLANSRI